MSYFKDPTRVPQNVIPISITRALQQRSYPFEIATSLDNMVILKVETENVNLDNATAVMKYFGNATEVSGHDVIFSHHQMDNGTQIPVMFIGKLNSTLIQGYPGWYFFAYEIRTADNYFSTTYSRYLNTHYMFEIDQLASIYFAPRVVEVQQQEPIVNNSAEIWHFIIYPLLVCFVVAFSTTTWYVETSIVIECTWHDVQMVLMELFVSRVLDIMHGMEHVTFYMFMVHEVVSAFYITVLRIFMHSLFPDMLLFIDITWEHTQELMPSMWLHVMYWFLA